MSSLCQALECARFCGGKTAFCFPGYGDRDSDFLCWGSLLAYHSNVSTSHVIFLLSTLSRRILCLALLLCTKDYCFFDFFFCSFIYDLGVGCVCVHVRKDRETNRLTVKWINENLNSNSGLSPKAIPLTLRSYCSVLLQPSKGLHSWSCILMLL